jgi:dihydrofolate reductase
VHRERKLIITENITLDGVIEATEGWFAPAGDKYAVDNSDIEATLRREMEAQDALLFGRKTFEEMRGYWPHQPNDTTGITHHLNEVSKYVLSRTLQDPQWENTTVLQGSLKDEAQALKAATGKDIGITGSITVVHELIAAGLVDECRLFVYPVVLGGGERLFADATDVPRLRLLEAIPRRGLQTTGRARRRTSGRPRGRSVTVSRLHPDLTVDHGGGPFDQVGNVVLHPVGCGANRRLHAGPLLAYRDRKQRPAAPVNEVPRQETRHVPDDRHKALLHTAGKLRHVAAVVLADRHVHSPHLVVLGRAQGPSRAASI